MKRPFLLTGISGAMAVGLGALGAHALKQKMQDGLITPDQLNAFDTAARYQMYHTLAIGLVLYIAAQNPSKALTWSVRMFTAGIVLFSGSLYFLSTRALFNAEWLKVLGPVTPLGGLCFMAGWICFGLAALKKVN